jgi:Ca2+-dependent lipid-binding protein
MVLDANLPLQCAQYIAPKSLTLNLAQLLAGDGVKKDTLGLGVLVITLHHAEGLEATDRGAADPYIVLAYAKFGKPLYSSRIIQGDLNPVWEETAFLIVTEDEVKGEEDLSATLWDSDKRTADDLVGRVTIPLTELMRQVGGSGSPKPIHLTLRSPTAQQDVFPSGHPSGLRGC